MLRKVFAVLVVATVVLAVPTAAVTGSEDDAGAITMSPHSGPNGQYASVNSNGDIEISFTELNDDAITTAHDVFNVTNDADCGARVWVEIENVTAYRHDEPSNQIDSKSEAVVLAPNETLQVGLQLDTRGATPDPGSMTVHATEAASCADGTTSTGDGTTTSEPSEETTETPEETTETPGNTTETPGNTTGTGEAGPAWNTKLTVESGSEPAQRVFTFTVTNVGNETGTYDAELTVNGTAIGGQTMTIQPGETREVTFTNRFGSGTYAVAIGQELVTITVGSDAGIEFRVTDLRVQDERQTVGNSTTVVATVENRGNARGTYTAVLMDNGRVIAEKAVTVPAGESREVLFTPAFDDPGAHNLSVADQRASVIVEQPGALKVVAADVADERLEPGNVTTITATVENTGSEDAEATLDLEIGGAVIDTVTITVPAGETRTVSVQHRFEMPGIYTVRFGGVSAGEVTVRAGATTAERLLTSSLGVAVGLPLVLGLVLAIWRRRLFAAVRDRV